MPYYRSREQDFSQQATCQSPASAMRTPPRCRSRTPENQWLRSQSDGFPRPGRCRCRPGDLAGRSCRNRAPRWLRCAGSRWTTIPTGRHSLSRMHRFRAHDCWHRTGQRESDADTKGGGNGSRDPLLCCHHADGIAVTQCRIAESECAGLLQEGQDGHERTCPGERPGSAHFRRRKQCEGILVVVNCQRNLFQIVPALSPPGGLPRLLYGRQQQGSQDRDDRNHNQ